MPTATYNKFNDFVEQVGLAKHDFNAHTFKCYLSNTTPSASLDAVKADLAEIAAGNGYTAGGHDSNNAWSESGGIGTMTATDIVITASGGSIGPFQYVIYYNDDQTSPADPLVCWWDYGSPISISPPDTFTIDFGSNVFTLQ
jgi:hypothetical protein